MMLVETYEVISNDPSKGDNALVAELESPEAQEIIERLGLGGQQSLLTRSDSSGATVRNPYRRMTEIERRVYGELLPEQTELEKYSDGPIPLRVLQVAAHARDLFPRLEVWHEPGSHDDPLLVGCDDESTWSIRQRHMLARWADTIKPFEELVPLAAARLAAKWRREVGEKMREGETFLRTLDDQVAAYLAGQRVSVPS